MGSEEPIERNPVPSLVDRLVLRLGNSNRSPRLREPLTREEFERKHTRIIVALVLTIIIIFVGNGVGWQLYQGIQDRACHERAERAAATAPALEQVAAAARADGNSNTAKVWEKYLQAARENPLPRC